MHLDAATQKQCCWYLMQSITYFHLIILVDWRWRYTCHIYVRLTYLRSTCPLPFYFKLKYEYANLKPRGRRIKEVITSIVETRRHWLELAWLEPFCLLRACIIP